MISCVKTLIDSRLKWIFLVDFISGIFMIATGLLLLASMSSRWKIIPILSLILLLFVWTHSRFGAWRIICKTRFSIKKYLYCISFGFIFAMAYFLAVYWSIFFIFQKVLYFLIAALNISSPLEMTAIVFIWQFLFGILLFLFLNLSNLYFSSFASSKTIRQNLNLFLKPKKLFFHALASSAIFAVIFLVSSLLMRLAIGYIIAYFIYVLFFSWYKLSAQKGLFQNG